MLPIAQLYLPLPIVHTIGCSSIAFVYIFDYFVNGSKMTNAGLLGILSAIIGVVLMTNSRLLMSLIDKDYVFDSKFGNYIASTILFSSFVAFMLFAARVFNSYGLVKLKHYP